jgi:hypothetical protein
MSPSSPESWVLVVVERMIFPLTGTEAASCAFLPSREHPKKSWVPGSRRKKVAAKTERNFFIVFSFTQWWAQAFPSVPYRSA